MSEDRLPLTRAARERRRDLLRDQQRREADLLTRVTAAEDRLDAETQRAERAAARARAKVTDRRRDLDAAIAVLAEQCGPARAAVLLERSAAELTRIRRAYRGTGRDRPA